MKRPRKATAKKAPAAPPDLLFVLGYLAMERAQHELALSGFIFSPLVPWHDTRRLISLKG